MALRGAARAVLDMPKNRPAYRPYVVMVQEQDSRLIRQAHTLDERPTVEAIWHVLVKAMRSPVLATPVIRVNLRHKSAVLHSTAARILPHFGA